MRERERFDRSFDAKPEGSGEIRKLRFSRYSFSVILPILRAWLTYPRLILEFAGCEITPPHGSVFLIRSRRLSMLNTEGSRPGLTSDQCKGVDTGARGRRRTEYGATTV